ncbi:MAG: methyltransferase domain-containing protein [bacterium]
MTGAAYANASKLQVLLGKDLLERLRGKDVLDFGCGVGAEAVEVAGVARSVFGLDILTASLEKARERAAVAGVSDKCTFGTTPPAGKVDAIISLDSFEHFGDPGDILRQMYDMLRPGGQVVVSFGPPWFHPFGGHFFSIFPWAHLVFSEAALIEWRSAFKTDGARRFSEVEGGLNQMTVRRFEKLVAGTSFRLAHLEVVPIRKLRPVANRITREFTTSIVRCVLERPSLGNAATHDLDKAGTA